MFNKFSTEENDAKTSIKANKGVRSKVNASREFFRIAQRPVLDLVRM